MYIGNDLQIAHPSYKIIDDISSGFNGSTTSFALQVSGATPVPFPISTQQVMISVNGVVQEPDPTGSAGFKLLGSNIVFSSAPANGHAFFGVINAGADYVTAGSEFPDGSATAPSFTFQDDQDTGWFRSGSGAVGYSANGAQTLTFDGNGLTVTGDASFVGDSAKNLLWDKSDGALEFADNAKATFGTGADLTIKHESSTTYATNITGGFYIQSNTLALRSVSQENYLVAAENGAVELYHNNVKKFETTSGGIKVIGNDGVTIEGAQDNSADLFFHADGGDDNNDKWYLGAYAGGPFKLLNYASGSWESNIEATGNGAVNLYYDNAKKFATDSDGFQLTGQASCYLDLYTYESSTATLRGALHANNSDQVGLVDSQLHWLIKGTKDGTVNLYHNNVNKFETVSYGVVAKGSVEIQSGSMTTADSTNGGVTNSVSLGTGNDFRLFHDGSHNYILGVTGDIILKNSTGNYFKGVTSSGAAELNFNNQKKFETTNTGITITGSVVDSKGDLRTIPQNYKTSAYTLTGSDAGKHIYYSGSAAAITVPSGQFNVGDAVTIISANSSTDITIVQSGTTIYFANDGTTGTRTLASKGMATLICVSSNVFAISGAGLS